MALEYFLYRTDYNNTLVDRSNNSFAPLPPNSGEINIDYFIPKIQPLYLYKESGGTIVHNDTDTINDYLSNEVEPQSTDPISYDIFTGYTANTNTKLDELDADNIFVSGTTGITLQDLLNYQQSAGRLTIENDIGDNGDGSVSVGAGTGIIKTEIPTATGNTARELVNWGNIVYVTWDAVSSLTLIDNAYNYIYYDGDDGQIKTTANINDISYYKDFTLGRVVRIGTKVTIRICGMNLWNFQRRVQMFGEEVFPVVRARGLLVGEAANRTFTISEGILWAELINRFSVDAKASTDTFSYWYVVTSTWTEVAGQTQISNTQYNNISTGLVNFGGGPNHWGVHWVYAVHDGSYHVVYGQDDYNLSEAQNAQPPAILPLIISSYGTLCAKIIIQKNENSFTEIQSAFATAFVPATTTQHNETTGIQGGAVDDYQHLTTAQVDLVNSVTGKTDTTVFNSHTGDTTIHFTQGDISITESQISDLQTYALQSSLNSHTGDGTIHFTQGNISITESQISDLGTYLTQSDFNIYSGATDTRIDDLEDAAMPDNYLGEETDGGILFHIYKDSAGWKGLVVSKIEGGLLDYQDPGSFIGANRSEDGKYNYDLMTNSPIKNWVENNLNSGGETDWYIPAIDELMLIIINRFHINRGLRAASSATLLTIDRDYWSSTEDTGSTAYFVSQDLTVESQSKTSSEYVRGIKKISL